jgi:hypothetical protein
MAAQSPLPSPPYLDEHGSPHKDGMVVNEPPVCSRCSDRPESLTKLEQHVRLSKTPTSEIVMPKHLIGSVGSRISLSDPLPFPAYRTVFNTEWPPNRSTHIIPPSPEHRPTFRALDRQSTCSSCECTDVLSPSTTPPHLLYNEPLPAPEDRVRYFSALFSATGHSDNSSETTIGPFPDISDDSPWLVKDIQASDPSRQEQLDGGGSHVVIPTPVQPASTGEVEILPLTLRKRVNSLSSKIFERDGSVPKRRFSLRRSFTLASTASASLHTRERSFTSTSQQMPLVKAPFMQELSDIIFNRAGRLLTGRASRSGSGSSSSTCHQGILSRKVRRICGSCGAEVGGQKNLRRDLSGIDTDVGIKRLCSVCED